nr:MAG TPA: hypothetical protein [Bacteriophage sp.]
MVHNYINTILVFMQHFFSKKHIFVPKRYLMDYN